MAEYLQAIKCKDNKWLVTLSVTHGLDTITQVRQLCDTHSLKRLTWTSKTCELTGDTLKEKIKLFAE